MKILQLFAITLIIILSLLDISLFLSTLQFKHLASFMFCMFCIYLVANIQYYAIKLTNKINQYRNKQNAIEYNEQNNN